MSKATARQRVFAYLKKQRNASAKEIGQALKMSAASVRHHLSILGGDGMIATAGVTHIKERGRPVKVYKVSDQYLGDNLSLLSSALLTNRLEALSASKRQAFLQTLAEDLADQIGVLNKNDQITRRLTNLLEKLNALPYQARWEAGAEGPRILFAHCPYARIIEKHPELCQMDGYLLAEEMGTHARQLAKMDQKPGGIAHCVFLIS
jgi:predicted ArsR family transcriptional regulator